MSVDDKCLDVWGLYGTGDVREKIIHLEYNTKIKGPLRQGFHPFFEIGFKKRDRNYRKPSFERIERYKNKIRYNFHLIEFFEAFLGSYKPEDLALLLEHNTYKDSPQGASFVKQVRDFEKNFHWCFSVPGYTWHKTWFWQLCPVNFSVDDLENKLKKAPSNTKSGIIKDEILYRAGWKIYFGPAYSEDEKTFELAEIPFKFRNNDTDDREVKNQVRDYLVSLNPPILLLHAGSSLSLDDKYSKHFHDYFKNVIESK
ncbi:MAG: hypothetical protein Q8O89_08965 [Nanoarchaeota archaeon]|nr:hypothetical protein [Nanoarchaeota archaeon]